MLVMPTLCSAAITKGGFFYHFDGKAGLAKALIERYLKQDDELFNGLLKTADSLSEDPLHQLLIFLKLLADILGEMENTHPGCLVASFTYENQQFKDEIRELMRTGIVNWRMMILKRLEHAAKLSPETSSLRSSVSIADMFTAIVEVGIVLARNFEDNQLLVDQVLAYRTFIRVLFAAK